MDKPRLLKDPSLWILVAVNGYLIYYYYQHPQAFTTLVWLYWAQSVTLGFFNFLDILTVRKVAAVVEDPENPGGGFGHRIPVALFFLVHYGGFHLGYFIFLFTIKPTGPFDFELFKYFFLAFFFGQILTFIQHKIQQRKEAALLVTMFFKPYLRIVPMHLTILLPGFLHVTHMGVFIVLKSIADVLMYMITRPGKKNNSMEDKALLSSQQGINL
jgi:hypothetical protein